MIKVKKNVWIKNDGKSSERPEGVEATTKLRVRYRASNVADLLFGKDSSKVVLPEGGLDWVHHNSPGDVMEYMIVEPSDG
jgi:predicted HTH transcriptional regulator